MATDGYQLPSGEEAGTAPGDRAFRPDVEGLRAVAVLLVVLYHAGVPHLTGGYVGVDVFFVISGFVITGLLLRERQRSGATSILSFYARRARRILPAATLVIVVAVGFSYILLDVISGNSAADDGRWAAVFLSNFHFEAQGTSYLTATLPPSPLQNYWSLSVEEQFYVVYPTLFLVVARMTKVLTFRIRMAIALGVVIVSSFWLSVTQTASHPLSAYFSPFSRAWELALGALVALATPLAKQIPSRIAVALTWSGLAAIVVSAFVFNANTTYPGSWVAVPVVGAALIITGGTVVLRSGAEAVLRLHPFQWLGRRSYSLYLWHWPILILAAEHAHKRSLSLGEDLGLVLVALIISAASYSWVENPIRHLKVPAGKSVAAGVTLVVATLVILSLAIAANSGTTRYLRVDPAANEQALLRQVAAAPAIQEVPTSIKHWDDGESYDQGGQYERGGCQAALGRSTSKVCILGDVHGRDLMVVDGDSKALMWLPPLIGIAERAHWRLIVLGKDGCPATLITIRGEPAWGEGHASDTVCDQWHARAVALINQLKPNLLVVSQADYYSQPAPPSTQPVPFTSAQWHVGLERLFHAFSVPHMKMVMLGSTPIMPHFYDSGPPVCLAEHPDNVHACWLPVQRAIPVLAATDRSTALANGVQYVDTTPWFCSSVCTPIIAKYEVYDPSGIHVSGPWARYLQNVLGQSLGFPEP